MIHNVLRELQRIKSASANICPSENPRIQVLTEYKIILIVQPVYLGQDI